MSVAHRTVRTERGDCIDVTLFTHASERPAILLSVTDADDSRVPTAEFTLTEAADLREAVRQLCERATFGDRARSSTRGR